MMLGDNGLINKSKTSVAKYENEQEKENTALAGYEAEIDNSRDTVTIPKEEYDQMKSDIQNLKNINNYSTEEKVIGIWIDGKPIYQITINLGSAVRIPNDTWTEINFSGTAHKIDTLLEGYGTNGNKDFGYNNSLVTTRSCPVLTAFSEEALHSQKIFIMSARHDNSPFLQYITIRYTKTTDTPTT